MKKIQFFFVVTLITGILFSCQKEEFLLDEMQNSESMKMKESKMIPFKGDFYIIPFGDETIDCTVVGTENSKPIIANNQLLGNATHLGILDEASTFINTTCYIYYNLGYFINGHDMTIINKNGDGLKFSGESFILSNGIGEGYYEVVEGYGKFTNASGWINTNGNIAAEGGPVFSANGMVTQPNY